MHPSMPVFRLVVNCRLDRGMADFVAESTVNMRFFLRFLGRRALEHNFHLGGGGVGRLRRWVESCLLQPPFIDLLFNQKTTFASQRRSCRAPVLSFAIAQGRGKLDFRQSQSVNHLWCLQAFLSRFFDLVSYRVALFRSSLRLSSTCGRRASCGL